MYDMRIMNLIRKPTSDFRISPLFCWMNLSSLDGVNSAHCPTFSRSIIFMNVFFISFFFRSDKKCNKVFLIYQLKHCIFNLWQENGELKYPEYVYFNFFDVLYENEAWRLSLTDKVELKQENVLAVGFKLDFSHPLEFNWFCINWI